jgi:hypothetical protein
MNTQQRLVADEIAILREKLELLEATETCADCGRKWSPSLIESGHCIFCLASALKRTLAAEVSKTASAWQDFVRIGNTMGIAEEDLSPARLHNACRHLINQQSEIDSDSDRDELRRELQGANDMLARVHSICDEAGIPKDDADPNPDFLVQFCEGHRVKLLKAKLDDAMKSKPQPISPAPNASGIPA